MNDNIKNKGRYIGIIRTVYEKCPEDIQILIYGRDKGDGIVWIADYFKVCFEI